MSRNSIDVAIVGAGPYGLSVAAHVGARDVSYRIFGSPMHTWRSMPKGMLLRSPGFGSDLSDPDGAFSLAAFWAASGRPAASRLLEPIPLDTYLEYADWFMDKAGSPVEDVLVRNISRSDQGFALELDTGEVVRASRVVLAVGLTHYAYVPPELAQLPLTVCSHSTAINDPALFAGRDVVIVGAGQSALEDAALLHEAGAHVHVVARCNELEWTDDPLPLDRSLVERLRNPDGKLCAGWWCWAFEHLPLGFRRLPEPRRLRYIATTFGPRGAYWLRDRLADVPITLGRSIARAEVTDGAVRLELAPAAGSNGKTSPTTLTASHVVAATGYRVDLGRLGFLGDDLRRSIRLSGPAPALSSHFESSVRGLYFVGASSATSFGPVTRFVAGAGFTAKQVARHVAAKRTPVPSSTPVTAPVAVPSPEPTS
jgi:lysine/ornithine N-monooxygenase